MMVNASKVLCTAQRDRAIGTCQPHGKEGEGPGDERGGSGGHHVGWEPLADVVQAGERGGDADDARDEREDDEEPRRQEGRVDRSEKLTLDSIRQILITLEDSIIFGPLEKAQYRYNADTYDSSFFHMDGFEGSLVDYMVRETEKLHVQVGRYKSPDEHPFFPDDLPETCCHLCNTPSFFTSIRNIAHHYLQVSISFYSYRLGRYMTLLLVTVSLSKRIHYGKFVAEAKFQASPDAYKPAIKAQASRRVEAKARILGQDVKIGAPAAFKINPSLVAGLYRRIMPLTKEVQVAYLLGRLD
ncbi:hypothetical protein SETIT_6G146100v2 [Setaria italica]|uniref:chorismate mutase n=1 Tax=Setaria italica TaxID=4555 RepID=A0A368RN84_SETIT|nr:hypothetical protein SETIT_6G146100v2 [Setaria italica]